MLIYAGIDEAGYGPLLGPLCVSAACFVVQDHDPADGAPDLWKILRRVVSRAGGDRRGRIAIDDSKKLKGARSSKQHPLRRLERGVLAFLGGSDNPPSDGELFAQLGVEVPECGWYGSNTSLPVGLLPDQLRIDSARLHRALRSEGVCLSSLRCEAIDAAHFNSQVDRMGTKAAVNFCAAMRLVDSIWRQWPGEHARIIIDRHGGRRCYREPIQMAFPETSITVVAERDGLSRYHLDDHGRELTISFLVEAEQKHLPVALASMTAKYTRELMMARLNQFFKEQLPELKPTAGYYQDGRRFLEDIAPVLSHLQINRSRLVRCC